MQHHVINSGGSSFYPVLIDRSMYIDESTIQENLNSNIGHRLENANIRIIHGKAFLSGAFRFRRTTVRLNAIVEVEDVRCDKEGASLIVKIQRVKVSRSNNSRTEYYLGRLMVQLMKLNRVLKLSDGVTLRWPFIELDISMISQLKETLDQKLMGMEVSDAIRVVDCSMVESGILMRLDIDYPPLMNRVLSLN